ncbi:MAG: hypothetical protein AAF547_12420 [Actinomycetota bacterium]
MAGPNVTEVSADTTALTAFVDRGHRHAAALGAVADRIERSRSTVVAAVGPDVAVPDARIGELLDETVITTAFVALVRDALAAFDPAAEPDVVVDDATIDWVLRQAGLSVTGTDRTAAVDRVLAERAAAVTDGPPDRVVEAVAAHRGVVDRIDNGDDLGISNGELNGVRDLLADLDPDQRRPVMAALTDQQLVRLFHNVHSTGWFSNDWSDRERTEFYDLLATLPTDLKAHLGDHSPYLEALAEAEEAIDDATPGPWPGTPLGDPMQRIDLDDLADRSGFREDLSFDERAAVLWQAANYPDDRAVENLGLLSDQDWFQDFDQSDTERTAKLIAYLSQHGGDRTVIDNTLDSFLAPDAPYWFDWSTTGTAYGSAGGERFRLNPIYVDDGNAPLDDSGSRTAHLAGHTVAHEVNHLVNEDRVSATYAYFMAEYRAYYVGQLARYGTPPTRAEVIDRVEYMLTAERGAYRRIAEAVDDPVEGPLIADFATGIVGRPVTEEDLVDEIMVGVTDPGAPAPVPIPVEGSANILDNSRPRDGDR